MDALALCWTFDSRWVFGIEFKLYMIWVLVFIDLLTLIGFVIEEDRPDCCSTKSNEIILGLIIFGHICLMGVSYFKSQQQQKKNNYKNK